MTREDFTSNRTIQNIVDEFMYAYASAIIDTNHSATGNLALNQEKIIQYDGRFFSIYLSLEDYWKYLEYGTKPHFPPLEKIKEWIRIKPVVPLPQANGKLPTENQLAFLIGRKISRVGTPATHLLEDTQNTFRLADKIQQEMIEIIGNRIKEYSEEYWGGTQKIK